MSDELNQSHSSPDRAVSRVVARNILLLRTDHGLTLAQVSDRTAEMSGVRVPPATLSKIERKQARVDVDQLCALARVFGLTPAQMLSPMEITQSSTHLPRYPRRTED